MVESDDLKLDKKTGQDGQEVVIPISDSEISNIEKKSEKASEIEEKKHSVDTNCLEQLQRLQAEFSNYKKRNEKERDQLYLLAKGDMILKILPVLDDFERMIAHHENRDPIQCESIKLIVNKLNKILIDEGLEEIQPVGKQFDPDLHEAVGIEQTDEKRENLVLEEWRKGYQYQGKLLRPSHVKVGKHLKKNSDEK
jgi:molecular chaperone GrpE